MFKASINSSTPVKILILLYQCNITILLVAFKVPELSWTLPFITKFWSLYLYGHVTSDLSFSCEKEERGHISTLSEFSSLLIYITAYQLVFKPYLLNKNLGNTCYVVEYPIKHHINCCQSIFLNDRPNQGKESIKAIPQSNRGCLLCISANFQSINTLELL